MPDTSGRFCTRASISRASVTVRVPTGASRAALRPIMIPVCRHQKMGDLAQSAVASASWNALRSWAGTLGEPACRQRMAAKACRVTERAGA